MSVVDAHTSQQQHSADGPLFACARVTCILCRLPACFFGGLQERKTPLHSAAIAGSEAACRVLLEHGAEVNAPDQVMRGRGAWESMDVR